MPQQKRAATCNNNFVEVVVMLKAVNFDVLTSAQGHFLKISP